MNTPPLDSHTGAIALDNGDVPAIRLDKVEKRFGDHVVLHDLDFTVRKGDRVTLIGPSGSGKTTILRLVMTLEEANDGYIFIDGNPLTHYERDGRRMELKEKHKNEMRKRIGMVFQQFNLFPNMTVIENIIEAPVHVLGLSKKDAIARGRALLEKVGLPDKENAHPTQLSGGQQQRVAIARALMQDPEILLADEPVASLDPESSSQVMALIREIAAERSLTVICSLHQVDLALSWGDRIVGLRAGAVVLDTRTDDLSREEVMEIYGRVATTTSEFDAIDNELAEAREQVRKREASRDRLAEDFANEEPA